MSAPDPGSPRPLAAQARAFFTKTETFTFGAWTITVSKGRIMDQEQEESLNSVLRLPHLPDMLFTDNVLRVRHADGFGLELNAVDALKTVNDHEDLVRVALSEKWLEARKDSEHINKIVHPFDWTYTPFGYTGTLLPKEEEDTTGSLRLSAKETELKINYEKLKEREQILFFDDVILYEDELDDNGCSKLSAKIRVMPSGFFCLLRFYLRVDNTLVRVVDNRFHYEVTNDYILREYTERESKAKDLQIPMAMWRDQNEIVNHLGLVKEQVSMLKFPAKQS